ncbi:hypothetical protein SprV_0301309600 [Sparganum proliferum]
MKRSMDLFTTACINFGLVINTEKTVVMHRLSLDAARVAPQINVNGTQLQVVDSFTYLDSTLPLNTKIDDGQPDFQRTFRHHPMSPRPLLHFPLLLLHRLIICSGVSHTHHPCTQS